MKVTYNWLKDFVDIKLKPEALADKLTMAGLEVTSLEQKAGDFIFEIEITSNRPDWLSVIGIAREIAAVTKSKIKNLPPSQPNHGRDPAFSSGTIGGKTSKIKHFNPKSGSKLKIEIQDKRDCPLYNAKIIRDVKVGPSPEWLSKRLELIGCRSVNNIVDITNYIMFTYGQPLHAFDLDTLHSEKIIIRRSKSDERLVIIDGTERRMDSGILVIADENKAIAMAGVMGAKVSEVSDITKNVLLEAAVFNPILIRHARQRFGIQSESAYRFERTVDIEASEKASSTAVSLMEEIAQGECLADKTVRGAPLKKKTIALDISAARHILGADITAAGMKRILNDLGFKVKGIKNSCIVEVPTHRPDVNLSVDLIEEIARIFGYENVPITLPKVSPCVTPTDTRLLVSLSKDILVGLGLYEVITYSLADKESGAGIEILNPLSQEQEILRPTIIPALVRCVQHNLNQKEEYINIFEIANVFSEKGNQVKEEPVLGMALCGAKSLFLERGLVKDKAGVLNLKGVLEVLFGRLGIRDYGFKAAGTCAIGVYLGDELIGSLAQLNRGDLDKFGIKNQDVFVAEIFLTPVFAQANLEKKFIPLALYPGITRDISMVFKQEIRADQILQAARVRGGILLREVMVSDYYKGKQIPEGYTGLTISCFYRSDERTLTESEVTPLNQGIVSLLQERFSVKIR